MERNVLWSVTCGGIFVASPLETLRLMIIVGTSITLRCDASPEISKLLGKPTRPIQFYSMGLRSSV